MLEWICIKKSEKDGRFRIASSVIISMTLLASVVPLTTTRGYIIITIPCIILPAGDSHTVSGNHLLGHSHARRIHLLLEEGSGEQRWRYREWMVHQRALADKEKELGYQQ